MWYEIPEDIWNTTLGIAEVKNGGDKEDPFHHNYCSNRNHLGELGEAMFAFLGKTSVKYHGQVVRRDGGEDFPHLNVKATNHTEGREPRLMVAERLLKTDKVQAFFLFSINYNKRIILPCGFATREQLLAKPPEKLKFNQAYVVPSSQLIPTRQELLQKLSPIAAEKLRWLFDK